MQIESLHDRRRDDRIAADVVHKLHQVFNRLFPAHAVSGADERKIDRKTLEETKDAGTRVYADACYLSNTNARMLQRRHLCSREKVEAVLVVIFVNENL